MAATKPGPTVAGHADLRPGVSVIVPSYRGRDRLEGCLRSLAAQTLENGLFETVVVLNGPSDGSGAVIDRCRRAYPSLDITVLRLAEPGTSNARNAGIAAATRAYVAFVDDDDSVSPGYLETLLAHAVATVVPFGQIVNVDPAGRLEVDNAINRQTIRYAGRTVHPDQIPRALGFNACKLIPTRWARNVAYDAALDSGVDVVYFMALLAHVDLRIHVCSVDSGPDAKNAVYYRLMRPNSMSRRAVSFEFDVIGRLEVISRVDGLLSLCDERRRRVLLSTMSAQAGFIDRYLETNPGDADRVLDAIRSYGIEDFPYRSVPRVSAPAG
jgi:hypothetical protein